MPSSRSFAAERARIPGGRIGRLLALAALLAALSLLISSQPVSGQIPREFFDITVTTLAEEPRKAVEEHTSKPAASARESAAFRTISGPIQLKLSLGATPTSASTFPISAIGVTNGSVSSLETPNGEDLSEWTVVLTPNRSGTVRVSMVQSAIAFNVSGSNSRWHNLAWSREFVSKPGPPAPLWMGFTSANAYTDTDSNNNPTHAASFRSGRNIDLTVIYSEKVVVTGTPHINFTIDGQEFRAEYAGGSGTSVLVFKYRFRSGDPSSGFLGFDPLVRYRSAAVKITDLNDRENAEQPLPPVITRVAELRPSLAKGAPDPGRAAGSVVSWEVHFSGAVTVAPAASTPFLVFTVTKPDRTTEQVRASYERTVDSDTLLFSYTIPANAVASNSAFTLHNRHLVIPGGGFDILGGSGGAVNTQLPAADAIFIADVALREGESVVYPVARRGGSTASSKLIFVSGHSGMGSEVTVSPGEITFTQPTVDVTLRAGHDADNRQSQVSIVSRFGGLEYTRWTVTVLDDDPEIGALTPPAGGLNAGDAVEFRITTASAPVSGREVAATISQSGADSRCIDLGALIDADPQTIGIQIHARISDTAGGTAPFSVPTSGVFVGDCTVTASIAPPADINDERFFLISQAAELTDGALTASAAVIGAGGADPEPPTTDFPPPDFALQLSVDDSDAVITPGGAFNVSASLTYSGGRYSSPLEASTGRLRLSGGYFWEPSGQSTLSFSGPTSRCSFRVVNGGSLWTCALPLAAGAAAVRIPSIAAPGRFQITGTVTIQGRTYTDRLEVEVRNYVDEVAAVVFGPADQTEGEAAGEPYPTTILSGQSTKLQLRILNENGAASAPGSIAAINFHTSAGLLGASLGSGDAAAAIECAANGRSCQIPVDALTLTNVGSITLTVSHPGPNNAGAAQVRAAVIDIEGESFLTDPVAVTFLGGGETLTISEPRGGVYYRGTADQGAEQDDRDLLTLSVSAADAGGSRVEVPAGTRRWTIKGPDGRTAPAGSFSVAWPKGGQTPVLDGSRNLQVEIDVDSSSPLPVGEYTLELQAGRLGARQTFSVVSGAGSLTLSGPSTPPQVGESVTITAVLVDESRRPVTDGTSVTWASGSPSGEGVLIQLSADAATTNGAASARFFAVSRGSAYIRAESGGAADVLFTSIADEGGSPAAASAPASASADRSELIRGCGPSSWLGEPISASSLFASLEDPVSIRFWMWGAWIRYSRHHAPGSPAHGRLVPGSVDFRVPTGGVLSIAFAAGAPCPFPPPGG